ncbi:hypothetical protein E2C01_053648 [Portunus trituberculatus]|uniref:Uncharacterized protein n=1 Tax=Portunus trituberculatus TaxID=210409 RepID=A0A5B7GSV6_PORTR|nr:hypothetical protein [Portunus trituberculatus]
MARIYNWDVKRRRAQKAATEDNNQNFLTNQTANFVHGSWWTEADILFVKAAGPFSSYVLHLTAVILELHHHYLQGIQSCYSYNK